MSESSSFNLPRLLGHLINWHSLRHIFKMSRRRLSIRSGYLVIVNLWLVTNTTTSLCCTWHLFKVLTRVILYFFSLLASWYRRCFSHSLRYVPEVILSLSPVDWNISFQCCRYGSDKFQECSLVRWSSSHSRWLCALLSSWCNWSRVCLGVGASYFKRGRSGWGTRVMGSPVHEKSNLQNPNSTLSHERDSSCGVRFACHDWHFGVPLALVEVIQWQRHPRNLKDQRSLLSEFHTDNKFCYIGAPPKSWRQWADYVWIALRSSLTTSGLSKSFCCQSC